MGTFRRTKRDFGAGFHGFSSSQAGTVTHPESWVPENSQWSAHRHHRKRSSYIRPNSNPQGCARPNDVQGRCLLLWQRPPSSTFRWLASVKRHDSPNLATASSTNFHQHGGNLPRSVGPATDGTGMRWSTGDAQAGHTAPWFF